ncbi:hypothetical protein DWF00_15840 [Bosea caraganae]|uniref:YHS domain-containing protein n=1 Tax=Bosea caraganae TaxID=2763117 RepID=A0A370L6H5_9HYPH|nr:YHS domain-containing (seleno)protein [Bosea caraganae]RDJ25360.1 hypothetical protein DWE98_11545 [Bosea caraganae]RDJ25855.1 hypothetical protein DWF00_15840 [Bosea caraganae]
MKAVTWQRWISIAVGGFALMLVLQPAFAQPAALPAGLPELPALGEEMQRDTRSGLALRGYDPVAYQAEGRAVAGRPDYELSYQGYVWRFATAANREAFRDAPEAYEPAFAGFDPLAVSEGRAVESDPGRFAIVGSRLFLFRSEASRGRFMAETGLLASAEASWPEVSRQIAR